ncbi:hypothetical protein WN48_02205, partial [Eufriesea mexicana]
MLCVKHARKTNITVLLNVLSKVCYSRRSDKSINSYKIVQTNNENLNDVDGAVLGINSNWELLTPRGFRFYLPGSIGPGWSDVTTTVQVRTQLINPCDNKAQLSLNDSKEKANIEELFPGCIDVGSPQLTIITISQSINSKVMRWNNETETEKLAKYFVLAASDLCEKLRKMGYWGDFINPFSGQPHLNSQKNSTLYKTDERFRCLGFKIVHRNNCKVIVFDKTVKNFLGNLYTTAPASTGFLKEILHDCETVNVKE